VAAGLQRLGHHVDLQFRAPKRATPERLLHRAKQVGKRIGWLRRYGHVPRLLVRNIQFLRQERRLLQAFRPDVLLVTGSYCTVSPVIAARMQGVPLVLYCDTLLEYEYSQFYTDYYSYPLIGRWLEGLTIRAAERLVCISDTMQGYLTRYGIPAAKAHVIPNGVDHEAIRPHPPDQALRDKLKLTDRTVVGFLGTFQFFDNVESFMDVVQAVCKPYPRVVFLFVGEHAETSARLRLAAERRGVSNQVRFTGPIPHEEVARYLSLFEIALCPYRGAYLFYGSSMKLLEYMAAGKATVATALGQIKEVISDGYNGLLFEWGDYRALENKLLRLLQDEAFRHRLGENARRTIEQGWTWEARLRRLDEVLHLARRGRT
jgi:glycosyltransferase involved in cell wall biosynthesis